MAGIFETNLSAPQGAGANPLPAVQSTSVEPLARVGSSLIQSFGASLANSRKAEAEAANNQIISEYNTKYQNLEAARRTGMSNSMVKARQQALFMEYAAKYPQVAKDIRDATKGQIDFGTVGDVIDEEKALRDERKAAVGEAQKAGYDISIGDSPELQEAVISAHRSQVRLEKEAARDRQARADFQSTDEFERKRVDWVDKQRSTERLSTLGSESLPILNTLMDQLITEVDNGAPIDVVNTRWNRQIANWRASTAAASRDNPGLAAGWNGVIEQMNTTFQDRISGKLSAEQAANKVGTLLAVAKTKVLDDPVAADMFAKLSLAPNLVDMVIRHTNADTVKRVISVVGGEQVPLSLSQKGGDVVAVGKVYADLANSPEGSTEEGIKTRVAITRKVLQAIGTSTGGAPALKEALDIVSSPSFKEDLDRGRIDDGTYKMAVQVVNTHYNAPILRQLSDKFEERLSVFDNRNLFQAANIVATPDGIKIVPKKLSYDGRSIVEMRTYERALNTLVKANAHLSNTTDYKTYWEENRGRLFPEAFGDPDRLKVGDVVTSEVDGEMVKYRFTGGYVKDVSSWVPVGQEGATSKGKVREGSRTDSTFKNEKNPVSGKIKGE